MSLKSYVKPVLIGVMILPLCAMSYYLGGVLASFGINMCYTGVIAELSDQAQIAASSKDPTALVNYAKKMKELPVHGYESVCDDISSSIQVKIQ